MSDWAALAALAVAALAAAFAAAGLAALRRARRAQEAEFSALRGALDAALARPVREPAERPSRPEALGAIAEALRDDLDSMFLYVARLSDTVRSEIAPLADRLSALEGGLASAVDAGDGTGRLAALESALEARAAAESERIRRLVETVEALAGTLAGLSSALDDGISDLRARIDAGAADGRRGLEETRRRDEASRTAAAAALEDAEGRLSEKIERLDRALNRAAKTAAGAEARLGERLAAAAAPDPALAPRLDSMQRRLTDLAEGGAAPASLETAIEALRETAMRLEAAATRAAENDPLEAIAADLAALTLRLGPAPESRFAAMEERLAAPLRLADETEPRALADEGDGWRGDAGAVTVAAPPTAPTVSPTPAGSHAAEAPDRADSMAAPSPATTTGGDAQADDPCGSQAIDTTPPEVDAAEALPAPPRASAVTTAPSEGGAALATRAPESDPPASAEALAATSAPAPVARHDEDHGDAPRAERAEPFARAPAAPAQAASGRRAGRIVDLA